MPWNSLGIVSAPIEEWAAFAASRSESFRLSVFPNPDTPDRGYCFFRLRWSDRSGVNYSQPRLWFDLTKAEVIEVPFPEGLEDSIIWIPEVQRRIWGGGNLNWGVQVEEFYSADLLIIDGGTY